MGFLAKQRTGNPIQRVDYKTLHTNVSSPDTPWSKFRYRDAITSVPKGMMVNILVYKPDGSITHTEIGEFRMRAIWHPS